MSEFIGVAFGDDGVLYPVVSIRCKKCGMSADVLQDNAFEEAFKAGKVKCPGCGSEVEIMENEDDL